jgi:hypothetical protein
MKTITRTRSSLSRTPTSTTAEKFAVIDDKLCEFLGVKPDEKSYYRGWYDVFGLEASIGWDFKRMIAEREKDVRRDEEVMRMLAWFDENYTTNAWYSPKS